MEENKKDDNIVEKTEKIFKDAKDSTSEFTEEEIQDGKGMAVLSYILPFIPYFVEKKNNFVKYHAKQGMNLLVISVAYSIIYSILTSLIKVKKVLYYGAIEYRVTPWWVLWPLNIISIAITVIAIVGIINAYKGKAKELPIVSKIKIFK